MYLDGYSQRILAAELTHLLGGRSPSAAVTPQLSDYLSPGHIETERANLRYWRAQMDRCATTDGLPPGLQGAQGDTQYAARVHCLAPLRSALSLSARRLGVSLPILLHATLADVLRISWDRQSLLMQSVVLNRSTAKDSRVVACLANEVVMPMSGVRRFDAFVQQTSRSIASSMRHASYDYLGLLDWRRQLRDSMPSRQFAIAGACNIVGQIDLDGEAKAGEQYVVTPASSPIRIIDRVILQAASIESHIVVGRNAVKVGICGSTAVTTPADVRKIATHPCSCISSAGTVTGDSMDDPFLGVARMNAFRTYIMK
jgi:hypothetical protein